MSSNLAAIGFSFESADEFQETMLGLASNSIERLDCVAGSYTIWRSRTGAEIWFHLAVFGHEDDARDIAGLTPWYEGESEVQLDILERVTRAADNAFEGAFAARIVGSDGTVIPIVFCSVDFAAHSDRELPLHASVRLTGFARRLNVCGEPAAVGDLRQRLTAFVSTSGAVSATPVRADGDATQDLFDVRVTGRVLEHRELVNETSGEAFHWFVVDCGICRIDLVAEPDCVSSEIAVGCMIDVHCALFGRLLG